VPKLLILMKKIALFLMLCLCATPQARSQANDSNTPLHLLKPDYRVSYGIPQRSEVVGVMGRLLKYVEAETPAQLVDMRTGAAVSLTKIDKNTRLAQGGFRLTSYEWGVTYSAMLAAWKATGDVKYRDYALKRMTLLANAAPKFEKIYANGKTDIGLMRQVVDPKALDDAGAICSAMIKAQLDDSSLDLRSQIDRYIQYITQREHRLADGTFARNRPQRNSVWLDDMFMGVPAVAWMGRLTGDATYYEEALRQVRGFRTHMFVEDKNLFRHGWIEAATDHPAFFWGRANGWALLSLCEVLDALPAEASGRAEALELLRKHVRGLASLQQKDGFWHQLLDRNDTYLETSCGAIFTYCIAHAINRGWIDAVTYGPVALLGWHALASQVDESGRVQNVCVGTGMGFDPAFYAYRPVSAAAAHGYGPALWAAAEILQLLDNQHPKMNDSAVQFYSEEIKTDQPIFSVGE